MTPSLGRMLETRDQALGNSTTHVDAQNGRRDSHDPPCCSLLLLDGGSGSDADLEGVLRQFAAEERATGLIVALSERPSLSLGPGWGTVIVADVARIAAAFGVFALPAVVASGPVDEVRGQIEAIVRRQARFEEGRGSGALSSDDLR